MCRYMTHPSIDQRKSLDDGLVAVVIGLHRQPEVRPPAAIVPAQAEHHLVLPGAGPGVGKVVQERAPV